MNLIKDWEEKQDDLLFEQLLDGPYCKGRLIIDNIIENTRFYVGKIHPDLSIEHLHNIKISPRNNRLVLNIPKNESFIIRLRKWDEMEIMLPIQILTKDHSWKYDILLLAMREL